MPRISQREYCRLIVLAVLFLVLLCSAAAVAAECASGCTCMLPADAKAKGYDPCGGQFSVCGYDRYQNSLYCYKTGLSLVPRTVAPLSVATTSPQGTCAEGCSCMLEADAKQKFGTYSRCSENPCYSMVTGSQQLNAYCFRQGTTVTTQVPSCPAGCSCISNATATARGGTWTRCTADICGYEQGTATLAAVVSVPKYCMKPQEAAPACPDGCACISDEDAKLKGLTERCDTGQTPCGYRTVAATTAVAAVRVPLFCHRTTTTVTTETPAAICPENCGCMNEGDAKLKFGPFNYTRCSEKVCGYDQTATSAYASPRYCFRYAGPVTTTLGTAVCPQGCSCLQEAEATAKFGAGNYFRCQASPCGNDPSATSANGIPRYCFRPEGVSPVPVCPQGCACMTDAAAKENGLTPCRGTRTSCGYDENKQPLSCFEQVPSASCVYDYQKNSCAGSCDQGFTCGLLASEKDATGKITYAICGCTGQPVTPCTFDAQKSACSGTCQTGGACTVVGKNVDEKTGAATMVCGCPQQGPCSYNYETEACAGSCTVTGENCQLNTIYRDPSGKVTYADCQCKGGAGIPPACSCDATTGSCTGNCDGGTACTMAERTTDNAGKVVCSRCECRETCVLTANNECTGTCADQQPCTRIVTKDNNGQEKVSCGCGYTPSVGETPAGAAARQPGFFESLGSFFNRLFGGK